MAPSSLAANGVSQSQINLSWSHSGSNEDGFRIERSADAGITWVVVDDNVAANATSFSDTGLSAGTTYRYVVIAFNGSGEAASDPANGTTDSAPDLSLTASGYKVKGQQKVALEWTGGSNVNIYRDGALQAEDVGGGSYVDNIDRKGGGSYDHQVCVASVPEGACSNTTTTVF